MSDYYKNINGEPFVFGYMIGDEQTLDSSLKRNFFGFLLRQYGSAETSLDTIRANYQKLIELARDPSRLNAYFHKTFASYLSDKTPKNIELYLTSLQFAISWYLPVLYQDILFKEAEIRVAAGAYPVPPIHALTKTPMLDDTDLTTSIECYVREKNKKSIEYVFADDLFPADPVNMPARYVKGPARPQVIQGFEKSFMSRCRDIYFIDDLTDDGCLVLNQRRQEGYIPLPAYKEYAKGRPAHLGENAALDKDFLKWTVNSFRDKLTRALQHT